MAARTRKTKLTDAWKAKIQASMLCKRLQDHADGRVEMSTTQVRAADILLKKVAPDLSRVTGPGDDGAHIIQIKHEMT